MTLADIAAVPTTFDAEQYAECYPPGIEHGYWSVARNWFIADALADAGRRGLWDGQGKILEIGCGTGIVVRFLREQGYDATGVELAAAPILPGVAAHVRTGVPAAALPPAEREQVGAILLLDVIEHIEHPDRFLAEIAGAFSNCRCFLLTVPARQEIWSNYDDHYGHYRRYDRISLASALWHAGLAPETPRYLFRPLYLAALLLTLLRRPRQTVLAAPRWPRAHRLLAGTLYWLERALAPFGALPGSSLIVLATR
jgi:SAM-dependent methyltransferase